MDAHDAIRDEIPEFLAGRLAPADARRVEAHLEACTGCRDLVASLREVVLGFESGGLELLTPHPAPESLRQLASGDAADAAVMRHVETCASCSLEVEMLAAGEPQARVLPFRAKSRPVSVAGRSRRVFGIPASLAAGLMVGLGLGVLYRPISGPQPRPAASSGQTVPAWSGPVTLLMLERPLRGDATLAAVTVSAGQPYVPLAMAPVVPESAGDDTRFRFEIRDARGDLSWSAELRAADIRTQIRAAAVVTFLVPSGSLPAGRHLMAVRPANPVEAPPILEIPFEVR